MNRPNGQIATSGLTGLIMLLLALYGLQVWASDDSAQGGLLERHALLMSATGMLQTLTLFFIFRAMERGARLNRLAITVSIIAFTLLSATCANTSIDASAYIAYAKLGSISEAYHQPRLFLPNNGFDLIAKQWPELPPLVYGPLWWAIDRILISRTPSYSVALTTLRSVNVVYLLGLLAAVRALKLRRSTVAMVALNPMLYFYFIVQAHNDLLPILLVVAGTAIAARRPFVGAMVAGTAGLIKITFIAIATLAYAGRHTPRVTLGYVVLSLGITVVVSEVFGGRDYLDAMVAVGSMQVSVRDDALHTVSLLLHVAVSLIAGGGLAWALLRGAFGPPICYSLCAISTIVYPWYLGWCIPYAFRIPSFAPIFLMSLPGIAHIIDPQFALNPAHTFAWLDPFYVVVIALSVRHITVALRRRSAAMLEC